MGSSPTEPTNHLSDLKSIYLEGYVLTIIECEECNTKLVSSNYGPHNACDTCACGNLQIIHIESVPPSKLKGFVTVRYKHSYPNIYEILNDKPKPEKKEEKSFGFK